MRRWLTLAVCCVWGVAGADAQPSVPLGDDFQVNSYTPNLQSLPAVAASGGGEFVVVWQSLGSSGDDTGQYSIQAQAFDGAGLPVAAELQVNGYTTGNQQWPRIGLDGDGGFVVVWTSRGSGGSDTSAESIQGRRFNSLGQPLAAQFQVNTTTGDTQTYPDVAVAADGRFVVVWQSLTSSADDAQGYSIQGQLFAADGSLSGGEVQLNDHTPLDQSRPSVAMTDDGAFMVVWSSGSSPHGDTSLSSIQGRRFDPSGTPLAAQFQVNVVTTGGQNQPRVAADAAGNMAVVWRSRDTSVDDAGGIAGRRFAADGTPRGTEFRVNGYTSGEQIVPDVARDPDGDLIITWESISGDNGDGFRSIQGRRFASNGESLGPQQLINSFTTDAQFLPAVAGRGDGSFVVTWNSIESPGNDDALTAIVARTFGPDSDGDGITDGLDPCFGANDSGDVDADGVCADVDCNDMDDTVGAPDACGVCGGDGACLVWRDGFEKGDTSAWSTTVMAPFR